MAQYTVTHTCGHTSRQQLTGPIKDRTSRLSWLATVPCLACKRAAETATATDRAAANGLPALSGSDKQVAWAERIRAERLAEITAEIDRRVSKAPSADVEAEARAHVAPVVASIMAHTEAAWWIEQRAMTAIQMLRQADMARAN